MDPPFISVIITAHNRKNYLIQAVESALNQTLKRVKYEIIVVKNFVDAEIDSYLKDMNIIILTTKEEALGSKLKIAIQKSAGQVLCFLEDDDLFEKDKLQAVYEEFVHNSILDYYHNAFSIIDHNGKKISVHNYNQPDRRILIKRDYPDISMLMNTSSKGYMSSINIRKASIISHIDLLDVVLMAADYFMFYLSLDNGGEGVADHRVFTLYRVHESASNFTGKNSKYLTTDLNHRNRLIPGLEAISENINDKVLKQCAKCDMLHWKIPYMLYDRNASKKGMLIDSLSISKCTLYLKESTFLEHSIYGLLSILFPEFIKKQWRKKIDNIH